jgi:stearoyl-CoA desaturase (delta-9 desaturase)
MNVLKTHPIQQFRKNPSFYAMYDGFYLLLSASSIVVMWATGFRPLFGAPQAWWALVVPPLLFGLIWSHLVIHTCTHGSLPVSVNRLVGEILGVIVLVRFASWDIVHLRHHRFSDDRIRDPHPNFPSYWKTVGNSVIQTEQQLFQEYFDTWGDNAQNRQRERLRAYVSYGTNVVLLAAWAYFLGPWFTALVFLPTNVLAALFVIHFNWSTHNGELGLVDADFHPVNLDAGYYWIGNRVFNGIYMHKNHHLRPYLFNPARWKGGEEVALRGSNEPEPPSVGQAA